ncbi:MAG: hypothetical protein BRD43_04190 [Bacteroidetes bacterium QS_4_64_154]|nr:MAG: hypothetical protein BRD43_04190 [Bacteroidetes bacterium QS_4_64_154]
MTTRDPRHRGRRYDGAVGRQQLARWTIRTIRVLAVPTVLLSLLLAIDVVLPGTTEVGISYDLALSSSWVGPDGVDVSVGWPDRPDCLEQRGESGRPRRFSGRSAPSRTRPSSTGTGGPRSGTSG